MHFVRRAADAESPVFWNTRFAIFCDFAANWTNALAYEAIVRAAVVVRVARARISVRISSDRFAKVVIFVSSFEVPVGTFARIDSKRSSLFSKADKSPPFAIVTLHSYLILKFELCPSCSIE